MKALICYVGDAPASNELALTGFPRKRWSVQGRKPDERYVSVWIEDQVSIVNHGTTMSGKPLTHEVPEPGEVLAKGLINSKEQRDAGWFVAAGDKPTEAELKAAEVLRDKERVRLVGEARTLFRANKPNQITDPMRWAADRLGLKEPWLPLSGLTCPACGTSLMPGVALCSACGYIVDEEKFRTLRFAPRPVTPLAPEPVEPHLRKEGRL